MRNLGTERLSNLLKATISKWHGQVLSSCPLPTVHSINDSEHVVCLKNETTYEMQISKVSLALFPVSLKNASQETTKRNTCSGVAV